ncbi:MAG: MMPL family transporter [Myxococcales bacterium]|nr:MMPL family transporter [Myxococcales bacterium]
MASLRTAVCTGLLALLGLAGALAPRPVVDNAVTGWLDADRPEARDYARFQRLFGTDEVYVVTLEGPDALALLARARDVEAVFAADPVIEHVIGPAAVWPDVVDLALDPDLGGPAELARLAPRFASPLGRALPLFAPPRATVIALSRVCPPAARAALDGRLEAQRAAAAAAGQTLHVAGNPALNLALDRAGQAVQTTALPLLVGVCVIVLLLATRSPRQVLAALAPVGLGVLATDAALGLLGQPTNLLVDIAKPLIFVLLLASALHVLIAFQQRRHQGQPPEAAAWGAAGEKARGVGLALATTAIGFGSLALAPVRPIQVFGLLAAGGLALGAGLVLLGVPALLALTRAGPGRPPAAGGGLAARLIGVGARRRVPVIVVALGVVAAGVAAWPHLATDPHAIRYFPADHPLRRDYAAIEAQGLGLATVEVVIEADADLLGTPASRARLAAFEATLAALPGVQRALGPTLLLREGSVQAGGPDAVPEGPILADVRAAPALAAVLTPDGRAARVSLLIGTLDAAGLARLGAEVRAAWDPRGGSLLITGNYGLLLATQAGLLATLQQSLLWTALLIELVILLVLRSPRLALVAVLPNAVPVAFGFAFMAVAGLPLDVGTCMTAAVALGIAVDDTLHLLVAWQRHPDLGAIGRGTGRALLHSSLVIGAGFAVLLVSDFGPTRSFGLLCALAMATAVLADLLVVPALLGETRRPRG